MKKSIIIVLVTLISLLCLCACNFISENATSIEITSMPKTSYVQGESLENVSFGLKITLNDGNALDVIICYTENKWVIKPVTSITGTLSVENFSTAEVGEFTATITYAQTDFQTLTAKFEYSVNSTEFAGGTGTENNPFLIETAEQFILMDSKNNYYKLINDIKLENIKSSTDNETGYEYIINDFKGIFDGNNHNIEIDYTEDYRCIAIFRRIIAATVKNFNLILNKYACLSIKSGANSIYENINIKSNNNIIIAEQNDALFSYQTTGDSVRFENCNNYVDFNIIGGGYSAIYIGYNIKTNTGVKFINCNNFGSIQGKKVAMFVNDTEYAEWLRIENCNNYGKILGTESANVINAQMEDSKYKKIKLDDVFKGKDNIKKISCDGLNIIENSDKTFTIKWDENKVAKINVVIGGFAIYNPNSWYVYVYENITVDGQKQATTTIKNGNLVSKDESIDNPETWKASIQPGVKYGYNANNQWVFDFSGCSGWQKDLTINAKPSITVYAYDSNGVLLGTATC